VPFGQEIVKHWIENLFGRIPRLHQVVIEADGVDSSNCCICVGVCSEEHAPGVWVEL
jgi:hypothetical protein